MGEMGKFDKTGKMGSNKNMFVKLVRWIIPIKNCNKNE